jgi:hypothetical protein
MDSTDVEGLCAELEKFARRLLECPDAKSAKDLREQCRSVRAQMVAHPEFGNVAEQVSRISEAARLFEGRRRSATGETPKERLERALGQMHAALDHHRVDRDSRLSPAS